MSGTRLCFDWHGVNVTLAIEEPLAIDMRNALIIAQDAHDFDFDNIRVEIQEARVLP